MQDFRNLKVWEKAHKFTLKIYDKTSSFPKEEMYSLTSQVRRATYSISANIAEGCGRHTKRELIRFLQIAMGSASEVEYFLLLAKDLNYLNMENLVDVENDITEIKKMLSSLIKKLRS